MSIHEAIPPEETKTIETQKTEAPKSKNLLVNYLSLLGGSFSAKGFAFLTVLMLTRALGVEGFGQYSLTFSFWALLNTLVDLGSSLILAREIAHQPTQARPWVESALYLRLLGCLIFLPLALPLAQAMNMSSPLGWICILGVLINAESFYDVYFSATMRLNDAAKSRFFSSLGNVIAIALAIVLHLPVWAFILLAMLNPVLKLIYDTRFAPFRPILHRPDWPKIFRIAKDAWPLWLVGVQYIILTRVDTLMLQALSRNGAHELGIYSAAFRFSEIMALLVNALCPTLLPLLVSNLKEKEKLHFLAISSTRLILAAVLAFSLLIFCYAPWIVKVYGHGYATSSDCLRVLIWSQALVAINTVCYQLLVIFNTQGKRAIMLSGIGMMLMNIALNAVLIPQFNALGASYATVITEACIAVSMVLFLQRYTPIHLGKEILRLEVLALISLLPVLVLGWPYGIVSVVIFALLIRSRRLISRDMIKKLAAERLPHSA